jgi:hypothetical protein
LYIISKSNFYKLFDCAYPWQTKELLPIRPEKFKAIAPLALDQKATATEPDQFTSPPCLPRLPGARAMPV